MCVCDVSAVCVQVQEEHQEAVHSTSDELHQGYDVTHETLHQVMGTFIMSLLYVQCNALYTHMNAV